MKDEFERKENGKFILSPKERILEILKKEKEMFATPIAYRAHIHYTVLEKLLKELSDEGRVVIITKTKVNENNIVISIKKIVKWKK